MIYVTGDTHGNFFKFSTKRFPQQKEMTRNDFVIVCGDFGGIWDAGMSGDEERHNLAWLAQKPFTLLFVDGNHENFDRLNNFQEVDFHGGKAHQISENVFHLMRGNVFEFEGKKFFAFGGASSHDVKDGIIDENNYDSFRDLIADYKRRINRGDQIRINHISWWKEELPSAEELVDGMENLKKVDSKVDYVITHCLPQSAVTLLYGKTESDVLTQYFQRLIDNGLRYKRWFCGHYHIDDVVPERFEVLYRNIIRVV